MPRTTMDVDRPVLEEVRRVGQDEGKSMGRVVSELLAEALDARRRSTTVDRPFRWIAKPMDARVDLTDKEAVYDLLDEIETPWMQVAEPETPYGEPES